jgi:signal transduction histidine kinase
LPIVFFVGLYATATLLIIGLHMARARLSLAPVYGVTAVLIFFIWHLSQVGWWVRWHGMAVDAAILGPLPAVLCGAALTSAFDGIRAMRIYIMTVLGAAAGCIAYLEFLSSLSAYVPLPTTYYASIANQVILALTLVTGTLATTFSFEICRSRAGNAFSLALSIFVGLAAFLVSFAFITYGLTDGLRYISLEVVEFLVPGLLPAALMLAYGTRAAQRGLFMPARSVKSLFQLWKSTDRELGEVHETILKARETIVELRTLNRALKTEQELRRHQMEGSPLAIIEVDKKGNVLRFNQAGVRLLGADLAENQDIRAVLPGFEIFLLDRSHLSGVLTVPAEDTPTGRKIQVTVLPVFNNDYGPLLSLVAEDVTEREQKTLRQSMKQRVMDIHMTGRVISHDLSNLLLVIEANASALSSEIAETGNNKRATMAIAEACARCRDMIKQLGSQLQVFALPELHATPIVELAEDAIRLQKALSESSAVSLELEARSDRSVVVDADHTQMIRVLMNLIGNAIRASDAHDTIKVLCQRVGGEAIIDVIDTGHGMDSRQLEKAFEPGFSTKGDGRGGLGLAISWLIVDAHGGELKLESRVGQGTKASIRLPISTGATNNLQEDVEREVDIVGIVANSNLAL